VSELVKKGELSESQGAKLVREWTERADKSTEQVSKSLSDMISKTMEKMTLPSKDDIEKLNRKIQVLSVRVKKLEGVKGVGTEEE
jgi:polyhydroxyalkanoate synthesis regulator phasin